MEADENPPPQKQGARKGKWHIVSLRPRYMAAISKPKMRAVERKIARESVAQAKLRTVAAIRKERAKSNAVLLDADEKIEAYVAWAIEYTLGWAMGLESASPTRLFADSNAIAAFFLGSRKEREQPKLDPVKEAIDRVRAAGLWRRHDPGRRRQGPLKGIGDGKTNRKAGRKAQETAHIRATWV